MHRHKNHEKMCFGNQQDFIPFLFNKFDFFAKEVVDLLQRARCH